MEEAAAAPEAQATESGTCSICQALVPATLEQAKAEPNRFFMEGSALALVCSDCLSVFEPVGFVARYHVCGNPLCRRKWKQLTPKVLTYFCPSCKRHLENGIADANTILGLAPAEQMYQRWFEIFAEMSQAFGYPAPPPEAPSKIPSQAVIDAAEIRSRWRSLLFDFRTSFAAEPVLENVRNWNSVFGRRVCYRGVVFRGNMRYLCILKAEVELNEDLKTQKRENFGSREHYFLDWHGRLKDGDEVHFMAFPNPSVKERGLVSRILRLLTPDEDVDGVGPTLSEQASSDRPRPASPMVIASDLTLPACHGEVTLPSITTTTPDQMPMRVDVTPLELPPSATAPARCSSSARAAVVDPSTGPSGLPMVVLEEAEEFEVEY